VAHGDRIARIVGLDGVIKATAIGILLRAQVGQVAAPAAEDLSGLQGRAKAGLGVELGDVVASNTAFRGQHVAAILGGYSPCFAGPISVGCRSWGRHPAGVAAKRLPDLEPDLGPGPEAVAIELRIVFDKLGNRDGAALVGDLEAVVALDNRFRV